MVFHQGRFFISGLFSMVVFHHSGLSLGLSSIKVVVDQSGLLSGVHGLPSGVVFRQGWSFIRGGLSSGVVSHQGGLLTGWSFVHGGLLSGWSLIRGSWSFIRVVF